ncbi:hypothetical protein [Pedosphaera parvula]|uniref:Lipoprotein n=1 Tax=Pedosphaera parvula (strain Ellin514) TaxID=320771 RepID=B9XR03_PEDPL|nr:hypothetical protein [Pedosphaera parvula]EEF57699.1 hypothetical protein Cflav_PD0761 [Pedosphaera parvula Ellin514]
MRVLRFLVLLPLVIMFGCVHVNENSATASQEQIKAHLAAQLHCQTLELEQNSKDSFSGTGKNETGEFTIKVIRQGTTIAFHGVYVAPATGTFSGSACWSKSVNSTFGFHKTSQSTQDSLGTP